MTVRFITGDCRQVLATLPDESVHCVCTSPPYWGLRNYDTAGQIGLEPKFAEWLAIMVDVLRELRRVLRSDGTLWLNLGDAYANDGKWGGETGGKQHYLGAENRKRVGREKRQTGLKPKDLIGMPWRVAFALQDDGWWLRRDVIWSKPNPMPESTQDRPTTAHEYLFMLTKSCGRDLLWRHGRSRAWAYEKPAPDYAWRHRKTGEISDTPQAGADWLRVNLWRGFDYYYDADAIAEPAEYAPEDYQHKDVSGWAMGEASHNTVNHNRGSKGRRKSVKKGEFNGKTNALPGREAFRAIVKTRNKRSVWTVASEPYPEAHFATYPSKLIEPCILASCPPGGTVLDPFGGSGTTALVADRHARHAVLIELNPAYVQMARARLAKESTLFPDGLFHQPPPFCENRDIQEEVYDISQRGAA